MVFIRGFKLIGCFSDGFASHCGFFGNCNGYSFADCKYAGKVWQKAAEERAYKAGQDMARKLDQRIVDIILKCSARQRG